MRNELPRQHPDQLVPASAGHGAGEQCLFGDVPARHGQAPFESHLSALVVAADATGVECPMAGSIVELSLAKGARGLGATIQRHTRVTNIERLASGEWRVVTGARPLIRTAKTCSLFRLVAVQGQPISG